MQRWSFSQKNLLFQPGYFFEGLEIVFFRALLVGASSRGPEEISEFDVRLCVYQFQSGHLHGELSVVVFMFLNLSSDEGNFFTDHVCACYPVDRQVCSLAFCVAIVYREACTLQSGIQFVASAADPIRTLLGPVSGSGGAGISDSPPHH